MRVFYDTETTGFKPGSICQLAYLIENDQREIVKASNRFFTIPERDEASAMKAAEVTGLYPDKLKVLSGGHTFKESAQDIYNDFTNKIHVAHNIQFDEGFMSAELWRCGINFNVIAREDTMKLFTDICKLPKTYSRGQGQYKYPKLEEVAQHYNLNRENALRFAKKLFGADDSLTYHDARYDTTVMYIVCKLRAEELLGKGVWTKTFTEGIIL